MEKHERSKTEENIKEMQWIVIKLEMDYGDILNSPSDKQGEIGLKISQVLSEMVRALESVGKAVGQPDFSHFVSQIYQNERGEHGAKWLDRHLARSLQAWSTKGSVNFDMLDPEDQNAYLEFLEEKINRECSEDIQEAILELVDKIEEVGDHLASFDAWN